ncbi:MaoC family dehydratase [Nocardia sp. NPDC050799]|uniref:MaoC family dehydratase n=1 Tax=Nocardia sp. NPDC050799 TaxID=3154842 RepID=UPI0033C184F3
MTSTVHGIPEIIALAGRDLGYSSWKTVTQDLVDRFAEITGDHQWIHTDPRRAAAGPYGATIAHGYLVLSWLLPMSAEILRVSGVGMTINYGVNKVRFPAPVPVGSRIRLHGRVVSVEPVKSEEVQLIRALTVEVEDSSKPACVAESVTNYYPAGR